MPARSVLSKLKTTKRSSPMANASSAALASAAARPKPSPSDHFMEKKKLPCVIEKNVCDLLEKLSLEDVRVDTARNKFEARMGKD